MATWKDLDWREKWNIIDHVLTIVGQRVDSERKTHGEVGLVERVTNPRKGLSMLRHR